MTRAKLLPALVCLIAATGPAAAASVCLRSYLIARTDRPDDSTILFTMRDHTVWRNHLPQPCTGLAAEPNGFTTMPTDPVTDEFCAGLVTIQLNSFKTVCRLGDFTRLPPAPHS